jgi:hypothetical protein
MQGSNRVVVNGPDPFLDRQHTKMNDPVALEREPDDVAGSTAPTYESRGRSQRLPEGYGR